MPAPKFAPPIARVTPALLVIPHCSTCHGSGRDPRHENLECEACARYTVEVRYFGRTPRAAAPSNEETAFVFEGRERIEDSDAYVDHEIDRLEERRSTVPCRAREDWESKR